MDVKAYIDQCLKDKRMGDNDKSARLIISGKLHPSTDSYDTQLFYNWAKMAIREGTDRIKVAVLDEPNTWAVTILDKDEEKNL